MVSKYKKQVDVGEFAQITKGVPDKFGVQGGTQVYVAGSSFIPGKGDGYNFRKIFIVAQMEGDHVITDDPERKGFLMDGKYLRLISGKRSEALKEQLRKDYEKPEEEGNDSMLH